MLMLIFYAILAYLLYKLVFGFILPVYRATRQVKRSFRQMQEQMQQYQAGTNTEASTASKASTGEERLKGDYIDFEEIK